MAQPFHDERRHVVPRWRPFKVALQIETLTPAVIARREVSIVPVSELRQLQKDWQRFQSPVHAADLIDAAIVSEQFEVAKDAAEYLLSTDGNHMHRRMARVVLSTGGNASPYIEPRIVDTTLRYRHVAALRRRLRRAPRDAISWVDLAREYSTLGQKHAAQKALTIAVSLAPQDRFVLRAAARFYLHVEDFDAAHDVIRRSSRTRTDPWLLAAEIVAADVAGKTSRLLKIGRNMIESGTFSPRDVSELAGAIGTIEHDHGDRKRVRKLFARALQDPTENAVAQAGWLARQMPSLDLPSGKLTVPAAYEARAWTHFLDGHDHEAVSLAWAWLEDEPFATRAALFGSWVACTAVGDYEESARLAEAARMANPEEPGPLAQLIFCRATLNQLDEAEDLLRKLPDAIRKHPEPNRNPAEWEVFQAANRGLIAFRRGNIEDGRTQYEFALRLATENKLRQSAAAAFLYYALEEARIDPGSADALLSEAERALVAWPEFMRPAYEKLIGRARQRADHTNKVQG